MSPHPIPPLLLRVVLGTAAGLLLALGLALGAALAEGAADLPSLLALVRLLGPLVLAVTTAAVVQDSHRRGEWDAWAAMGHQPRSRWLAVLLLGLSMSAVGAPRFAPGEGALAVLATPAPVDPTLRWWPEGEGWRSREPGDFDAAPGSLATGELLARLRQEPPPHVRRGPYGSELIRRLGWLLAWPLASAAGLFASRNARRRGPTTASAATAGSLILAWCIAVLLCAGYASTMT